VTTDTDGVLHATIASVFDGVHSGFIVAAPQDRIGLHRPHWSDALPDHVQEAWRYPIFARCMMIWA